MLEYTIIKPPEDAINGYNIIKEVPVEFGIVGPVFRFRYTFRNSNVDPLVATGNDNKTASKNMLKELVDKYISSVEDHAADDGADDRHLGEIISELEAFIEASPNPDGSQ